METLHAPWRIDYILGPKAPSEGESLFTRISQSNDDVANLVISRRRYSFILLNRYPYNGGHLMVVPYRQVAGLDGLTDEEMLDLMQALRDAQGVLGRVMRPDGYNIGINTGRVAGAGIVEHVHVHIVPRWNGDTNFMPVLASTTVLPEALEALAAKLRAAF